MIIEHINAYWFWYVFAAGILFRAAAEMQHYKFLSLLPDNKIHKLENRRLKYDLYNALYWTCMTIFFIAVTF
jgi:hypothetical protein